MSDKKTPAQLIEERVDEMGDMGMYNDGPDAVEYKYHCMDTGMMFETYGESASYSPYTGSMNIEPVMGESVNEQPGEYMKPTDVPANQKNMQVQTPVAPNPAPGQPGAPVYGQNTPWAPNPAPDAQGTIGATQADFRGFVPYPQQSVPPQGNPSPGEKT